MKLNNYDYSRENLTRVVAAFLRRDGEIAQELTDLQRRTFQRRYGSGEFELKPRGRIIYKPLGLELVCKDDIEKKLTPLYKDPKIGTGMGIKSFYAKVLQKYIGINRVEVKAFLEKQTPYQLTKQPPRPINKPVVALYPNGRWEADLIDMAQYSGHNKRKNIL